MRRARTGFRPYVDAELAKQLDVYCAAARVTESAVAQEALREYLDRTSDTTLLLRRLDRLGRAQERTSCDIEILSEAFGIWVEIWFAHTPTVADDLKAIARRSAQGRYAQSLEYVSKRLSGGHVVRARVIDRTTGRQRELWKVLSEADAPSALRWIEDECRRIRSGVASVEHPQTRFCDYATSLFERKVAAGEMKSASSRERWRYTLQQLIAGTENVDGFGDLYIDQIRPMHVESWRAGIGKLIAEGTYAPATANGWLFILRHVLKRAKREFQLPFNAAEGVPAFDTSEHDTYTEEEPNALTSDEVAAFLACMKEEFPAQYAMAYLGFATGLRPSSMRPLRRAGPTPDVLWDQGVILVRRSHTLGNEYMKTTKTGLRQRITVPPEVMDVLRWHVDTQLETPEQKASELLFPAEDGRFRSESFLKKAFARTSQLVGLNKKFTPRGMRRTFNDLMRIAKVEAIVTKSISGHQTDRMREHYSTVTPEEQRRSIGNVVQLFEARKSGEGSGRVTDKVGRKPKKPPAANAGGPYFSLLSL
jgi:integrase